MTTQKKKPVRKQKVVITYDDEDRTSYLRGFKDRKVKFREQYHEKKAAKQKLKLKEARRDRKSQKTELVNKFDKLYKKNAEVATTKEISVKSDFVKTNFGAEAAVVKISTLPTGSESS